MSRFRQRAVASLLAITSLCVVSAAANNAQEGSAPNWKGSISGTTETNADLGVDVDLFSGTSSHLGGVVGEGAHTLNADLTFEGSATWIAADGSTLEVELFGQLLPEFDENGLVLPVAFTGTLDIVGGTGRLANADGEAAMSGTIAGIPGPGVGPVGLSFDFEGTLHPNGK